MAKRATLTDVSSGYASKVTLNDNFVALNENFDKTLSRDGSTPNQMEADLDMNSNDILNIDDIWINGNVTYKGAVVVFGEADQSLFFNSFSDFEDYVAIPSNAKPDGVIAHVDGVEFVADATETGLSKTPGWKPNGLIYLEHFGVNADLVFTIGGTGPVRSAGTSDLAAIEEADQYAIDSGKGFVFCKSDLYLRNQFNMSSYFYWETGFRNYLWCDVDELESGVVITDANGGISGINIIIQHNTTTKESDRGHHGNAVTVGNFMATSAQSNVRNIHVDVRVCRAADDPGVQDSYPSPSINCMGYVSHIDLTLGSFGNSNSYSSIFFQSHWGGHNATGDPTLEPVVTYHPNNLKVRFANTITDHRRAVVLSSVFSVDIGDFEADGAEYLVTVLVGDNTDQFTTAVQDGMPGKNIRFGHCHGYNMDIPEDKSAVLVTSRGTSKWKKFTGTVVDYIEQMEIDVTFKGITVENDSGNSGTRAVRALGAFGNVDFGKVYEDGCLGASVLRENGNAKVSYDVRKATAPIINKRSKGSSILGSRVDIATWVGGSGTYAVQSFGDVDTTTSTADVSAGDTEVFVNIPTTGSTVTATVTSAALAPIEFTAVALGASVGEMVRFSGFPGTYGLNNVAGKVLTVDGNDYTVDLEYPDEAVVNGTVARVDQVENHIGDDVQVGTYWVKIAAFSDGAVNRIETTPIPAAVSSGATITLDRTDIIDEFVGEYAGSEIGFEMDRSHVNSSDFSKVRWTGKYLCELTNLSRINITGDIPASGPRITPITNNYSFRIEQGSHYRVGPVEIPTNPNVTAHFQLRRGGSSGPWATGVFDGSVVHDIANLFEATEGYRAVLFQNCTDEDGELVLNPDRAGSDSNGEWVRNPDGTMECWARNVNIGGTQPYTWTFPDGGFVEVATVSVQVTPASATAPRMGHGLANASTTAQVWAHNDDGSDATSTGVNLYARGYWKK